MKVGVGVNLHKTQFTVYILSEDCKVNESGVYPANNCGYQAFPGEITKLTEKGYEITAAVESAGNTRYFHNQLVQLSQRKMNWYRLKSHWP